MVCQVITGGAECEVRCMRTRCLIANTLPSEHELDALVYLVAAPLCGVGIQRSIYGWWHVPDLTVVCYRFFGMPYPADRNNVPMEIIQTGEEDHRGYPPDRKVL